MDFKLILTAMTAAAWLCTAGLSPAAAAPGASLDASMKIARSQKVQLMGVIYYLKNNKVVGESWNSETAGWSDAEADKLRAKAMGARKLKSKLTRGNASIDFRYMDGTLVRYNKRRGRVITMDLSAPSFDVLKIGGGGFQQVKDWKEVPYKGKVW